MHRKKTTHSVRSHRHWKNLNNLAPPVRLEHIAGQQTVVNSYNKNHVSANPVANNTS